MRVAGIDWRIVNSRRGMARWLAVLGLTAAAVASTAPQAAANTPGTVFYLSLGDSLAQGFAQQIGGPDSLTGESWLQPRVRRRAVRDRTRDAHSGTLRLVKLGCGGATTTSMISGGDCRYPAGSQLAAAVEFLDEHPGQVAFVTIDIGANDVFACGGDPTCFVPQIEHNLPIIVSTLREHAGPDVPIVGMSYYAIGNTAWFEDPLAGQIAAANTTRLNDRYERLYSSNGALVADVEGAFRGDRLRHLRDPARCRSGPVERVQHLHLDVGMHTASRSVPTSMPTRTDTNASPTPSPRRSTYDSTAHPSHAAPDAEAYNGLIGGAGPHWRERRRAFPNNSTRIALCRLFRARPSVTPNRPG